MREMAPPAAVGAGLAARVVEAELPARVDAAERAGRVLPAALVAWAVELAPRAVVARAA